MKLTSWIMVAIVASSAPSFADPATEPTTPTASPSLQLSTTFTGSQEAERDWNNGKSRRNLGIGLTVGGAVIAGVGAGFIIAAEAEGTCPDTGNNCHYVPAAIGGGLAMVSIPILIVGAAFWVGGNREMTRAERGFGSLGALPYVAPLPGGGGVAGISLLRF